MMSCRRRFLRRCCRGRSGLGGRRRVGEVRRAADTAFEVLFAVLCVLTLAAWALAVVWLVGLALSAL
jgi:hypothetical protein